MWRMPVREADAGAAREMRQQSIWAAGPRVVRYGSRGFSSRVGMPEWVLRLFDQILQQHRFRMVHSREADAFFRFVTAALPFDALSRGGCLCRFDVLREEDVALRIQRGGSAALSRG